MDGAPLGAPFVVSGPGHADNPLAFHRVRPD